jgi:hypothetical protein
VLLLPEVAWLSSLKINEILGIITENELTYLSSEKFYGI